MKFKGFTTQLVHHDRLQNFTDGPVHAPIYNSVPYGYEKTEDLMDVFQGKSAGHAYARQSTPTINSLQSLITQTEEACGSIVFSTGMGAISALFLSLLKAGDHVIASQFLFGNTFSFLSTLADFGIEIDFVDVTSAQQVKNAKKDNTRLVFVETIANPGTQIPDLEQIGLFCESHNLIYVVDNTLTSPYLFKPKKVKASLVVNSLSKYFCGHGSVLGGAVTDTGLFDWQAYPHIFENYRKGDSKNWGLTQLKKKALRDMGATLSSDGAAQIALGSETLALRMDRACSNALALANVLNEHEAVENVYYPGLANHKQHKVAKELFRHFGALVSFDLVAGKDPVKLLNDIKLVINATHLGDNRTLALPMAQTIFFEMGAQNRKKAGISDGMIRVSVGIEDPNDLLDSFKGALSLQV